MLQDPDNLCTFTARDISRALPINERKVLSDIKDGKLDAQPVGDDEYIGYNTRVCAEKSVLRDWSLENGCELDPDTYQTVVSLSYVWATIFLRLVALILYIGRYDKAQRANIMDYLYLDVSEKLSDGIDDK